MTFSVELEWRESLAKATSLATDTFFTMSDGEVVRKLFEGCISPGIEVASDGIKLDIPDKFNIKVFIFQAIAYENPCYTVLDKL